MPYITSERVKEIRTQVKKQFPGFKFSIRRHHHSTVVIEIIQAPFNMLSNSERKYESVNPYYIATNYRENPAVKEVLEKLYAIMNEGNGTLVEDGDYGTVPNFYTEISIGNYDKGFKVVPSTQETTLQATNDPKAESIPIIESEVSTIATNCEALRDTTATNKKKRFSVISPDGFTIERDTDYATRKEAQAALTNWRKRYERQGYYSTANRDRIPLDELESHCQITEI